MSMKHIALAAIILFSLFSCEKDTTATVCNVVNPAKELPWLAQEIKRKTQETFDFHEYQYVEQGIYEGQTVFIFGNGCPVCNSLSLVFTCNGTALGDASALKITERKVIWTPAK